MNIRHEQDSLLHSQFSDWLKMVSTTIQFVLLAFVGLGTADITLPSYYFDGMVFQGDVSDNLIWGFTDNPEVEVLVEVTCVFAIHIDLGEHVELDTVVHFAELLDLVVRAGFLSAELVAREAEYGQALVFVFGVHGLQLLILGRQPAFAGHVNDQQDFPLIGPQIDLLSIKFLDGKVQGSGGFLGFSL